MQQRLPVLVCPNTECQTRIVLPYRTLQGTPKLEWYWPTDSETVALVCHNCGLLSVHSSDALRDLSVQAEDPRLLPSVFWRVTLSCSQRNCGFPIVAYIRTEEGLSHVEIGHRVYISGPSCAAGHPADPEGHVEEILRVESLGNGGWLT